MTPSLALTTHPSGERRPSSFYLRAWMVGAQMLRSVRRRRESGVEKCYRGIRDSDVIVEWTKLGGSRAENAFLRYINAICR